MSDLRVEAAARAIHDEGVLASQDQCERFARAALAAADAVPAGGVEAEPQKWTGAEILRTGRPVGEAVNPYRKDRGTLVDRQADAFANVWDEGFRAAAGVAEELAAALAELLDAVPGPGDRYVREQTASGRSGRHKAAFAAARDALARFRAGGGS